MYETELYNEKKLIKKKKKKKESVSIRIEIRIIIIITKVTRILNLHSSITIISSPFVLLLILIYFDNNPISNGLLIKYCNMHLNTS